MTMKGLFDNGFGGKLPGIQVFGNAVYNGGFSQDPGFIPWSNSNPTYTLRDNVTKAFGKHYFQFGAYTVAAQKNEFGISVLQGTLTFQTGFNVSTGNAFTDLLLGRAAQYQQSNLQPKYYNRYKILETYFQDDWRVNKRLTLNLGLRVSLFGTYYDRYKMSFNFDPRVYDPAVAPKIDVDGSITGQPGAVIPQSGNRFDGMVQCGANSVPGGCMTPKVFNPAPRLGLAWDPTGNGKMAIRAAYGVFFEHTNGDEANTESLEGTPPLVLTSTKFNIDGYNQVGGGGLFFPLQTNAIQTRAVWPYVQQWHLDVQRQVIKRL
jgi:TonB dependent receptor